MKNQKVLFLAILVIVFSMQAIQTVYEASSKSPTPQSLKAKIINNASPLLLRIDEEKPTRLYTGIQSFILDKESKLTIYEMGTTPFHPGKKLYTTIINKNKTITINSNIQDVLCGTECEEELTISEK